MENNKMSVYGYIRVSTNNQVENGLSLKDQTKQIELYGEALDYIDSGGVSQKQGAEDMFEVSERLSEVV